MSDLRLSLGINDYAHTRDIASGRIKPQGIDLVVSNLSFEAVSMRFSANLEFDIAEYSLANYCARIAGSGAASMTALPIFTSRSFRHSSIYVNESSGIKTAHDLEGRTVGIPQWSQTATVYVRGYLAHDIHVPLSSIRWVQAGVDQAGRRETANIRLPEGVRVESRPDHTLSGMLVAGEIDAVITARPPRCFLENTPGIRRLFPDYRRQEEKYFARTGIFPIMHIIAIRREIFEANRWIARNIQDAFEAAKQACIRRMRDVQTSFVPMAWSGDEFGRVSRLIFPAGDPWPYGLDANRTTLEAFLEFCYEQGVTARQLSCDELFPKEVTFEVQI